VVGTPIGNLEDITLRAIRVLANVALIAAEDTRVTRKLLEKHNIATPMVSCHQHSGARRTRELTERLRDGEDIALVADAGMPGVSDPGAQVVSACVEAKIPVVVAPGPTASSAALAVSGFSGREHVFLGFLPTKGGERRKVLEQVADQQGALVFYEAPHRVVASLKDMLAVFGDREAVCARELTKRFEELARGKLSELIEHFETQKPRGEFTLVVKGAAGEVEMNLAGAIEEVAELLAMGISRSRAVAHVANHRSIPRNRLYSAVTNELKGTE